jgi:exosortase B
MPALDSTPRLRRLRPGSGWRGLPALAPGGAWPAAALALAALPTLWTLAQRVWPGPEQSHGPVMLAMALWLMARRRAEIAALPMAGTAARGVGWTLLVLAALLVAFGRALALLQAEVLGLWGLGVALLLLARGPAALARLVLPLVAMLLVIPMPGIVVQAVTLPLKIGVSTLAESLLHGIGYPVARSGVVIAVDQYRLLVADACAGLASMFTLEAMGLLYMALRGPAASRWRDVALAILLVPIALAANVVRVVVLVLVVYHLGEAAVQGLMHGFAGLVLFGVAMALMLATDAGLARLERRRTALAGWRS